MGDNAPDHEREIARLITQAQTALSGSAIAKARSLLQQGLNLNPRNIRLLQLAAETADMGGQAAMAMALLHTALKLEPDNRVTLTALFGLCLQNNAITAASQWLERDHAIGGDDIHHKLMHARWLLAAGEEAKVQHVLTDALQADPDHEETQQLLAQLAMRQGRASAPQLYAQARAGQWDNVPLLRDHCRSLASQGDYTAALDLLDKALAAGPSDAALIIDRLALLYESGASEAAETAKIDALEHARSDSALRMMLADMLMQRDQPRRALTMLNEQRADTDHWEVRLTESRAAAMAGEMSHAADIMAVLLHENRPIPPLLMARHLIRQHSFADAQSLLESLVKQDVGNIGAWALLDCVWRAANHHTQHRWLHDPARMTALLDLGLDQGELDQAVAWLRAQHHARAAPTGQSLRRGTQTGGAVLAFDDDIARALRHYIGQAVDLFVSQWPDHDERHPMLRFRSHCWRFRGSWSVLLHDGGHHKSHIHPEGHIASASYWTLPDSHAQPGLLELGRPPEDLNITLEPLATITPQIGHLALFPSTLYHGTRPYGTGERMTLAFDASFYH